MKPSLLSRLLLALVLLAFACNAPLLATQPPSGGRPREISRPPSLIPPGRYSDKARELAQAIAELNRLQEDTIAQVQTAPPEQVDQRLRELGAASMQVAQMAEELARSTANQAGGGPQAQAAAAPYVAAAQMGYLMVIETQNMRDQYASGAASGQQVSQMVADMGSLMWSGDRYDVATTPAPFAAASSNPGSVPVPGPLPLEAAGSMAAQLGASTGKSTSVSAWATASGSTTVIRVNVPAPRQAVVGRAFDPAVLEQMTSAEGQTDSDLVRLHAAARVISLGATKTAAASPALASLIWMMLASGYDLEVTLPSAIVFQSDLARLLPYFPDGTGQVVGLAEGGAPYVAEVKARDGEIQVGQPVEVNNDTPVVSLSIDSITGGASPIGDTRILNVGVSWTTTMANPSFTLACFAGSGGSAATPVNAPSGNTTLAVPFSVLEDVAFCQAKSGGANLGESQTVAVEAAPGAPETPATTSPPTAPTTLVLNGAFTLIQTDDGCTFSAAPSTGGPIQLTIDFAAGTVTGTFSGGGSGVRPGLECSGNFGDLNWDQSYSGDFSGTVDANGAINATGTLSGAGGADWSNCHDAKSQPFECPVYGRNSYSYPITLTGTVDKVAGTGSGKLVVNNVNLPTSADWSAAK